MGGFTFRDPITKLSLGRAQPQRPTQLEELTSRLELLEQQLARLAERVSWLEAGPED